MWQTQVWSLGREEPLEKGNGNPPQYPCLENSMDKWALYATVHGVAKSWTQPSNFNFLLSFFPTIGERGQALPYTFSPKLFTLLWSLPIWRQECLFLMHTVLPHVLSVAFQEFLVSCPCFQHLLTPGSTCTSLTLLPTPVIWNVKGFMQGSSWWKLSLNNEGWKSRAVIKSFSPIYLLTATSHSLLSLIVIYSPRIVQKSFPSGSGGKEPAC